MPLRDPVIVVVLMLAMWVATEAALPVANRLSVRGQRHLYLGMHLFFAMVITAIIHYAGGYSLTVGPLLYSLVVVSVSIALNLLAAVIVAVVCAAGYFVLGVAGAGKLV